MGESVLKKEKITFIVPENSNKGPVSKKMEIKLSMLYLVILILFGILPYGCGGINLGHSMHTIKMEEVVVPSAPEKIDFNKFKTPKLHVTVQLDGLEIKTRSAIKEQQNHNLLIFAEYYEEKDGTKGETFHTVVPQKEQSADKDFITVTLDPSTADLTKIQTIPNLILFDDYWQMEKTTLRFKILEWNEMSPSAQNRIKAFLSNAEGTGKVLLDTGLLSAAVSTTFWQSVPIVNSMIQLTELLYNSFSSNKMLSDGWYSIVLPHNFAYKPSNGDTKDPLKIIALDEQGREVAVVIGDVQGTNRFSSLQYSFITKNPVGKTKDETEIRIVLTLKVERVESNAVPAAADK